MQSVKPGSVVLLATSIASDKQELVYAHVLSVGPTDIVDGLPAGLPSLSVAFIPPGQSLHVIGGVGWYGVFQRHTGVRHASHAEVVDGKHGIAWLEVLPDPSEFPGEAPALPVRAGVSDVYGRPAADNFFAQQGRRVPPKIAPVVVIDHSGDSKPPVPVGENVAENPAVVQGDAPEGVEQS